MAATGSSSNRLATCPIPKQKTTTFALPCRNPKLRQLRWPRTPRMTTFWWFALTTVLTISPLQKPCSVGNRKTNHRGHRGAQGNCDSFPLCSSVSPVVKVLTYSCPGRLVGVYIQAKAARKAWVFTSQSDLYLLPSVTPAQK